MVCLNGRNSRWILTVGAWNKKYDGDIESERYREMGFLQIIRFPNSCWTRFVINLILYFHFMLSKNVIYFKQKEQIKLVMSSELRDISIYCLNISFHQFGAGNFEQNSKTLTNTKSNGVTLNKWWNERLLIIFYLSLRAMLD